MYKIENWWDSDDLLFFNLVKGIPSEAVFILSVSAVIYVTIDAFRYHYLYRLVCQISFIARYAPLAYTTCASFNPCMLYCLRGSVCLSVWVGVTIRVCHSIQYTSMQLGMLTIDHLDASFDSFYGVSALQIISCLLPPSHLLLYYWKQRWIMAPRHGFFGNIVSTLLCFFGSIGSTLRLFWE